MNFFKRYSFMLLVLAAWLAGMISLLPANVISHTVASATEQKLLLSNAQGSIWHGNSDVWLQTNPQLNGIPLGKLTWDWIPAYVMQGKLGFQLKWNDADAGLLELSPTHMVIRDLQMGWPIETLNQLAPVMASAHLGGNLLLTSHALHLEQSDLTGDLIIRFLHVSSILSHTNPLGSYELTLNASKDQALSIRLSTVEGNLLLSGDGYVSTNAAGSMPSLSFDGTASAASTHRQDLEDLLHTLGNEHPNQAGVFHFHLGQ